MRREIEKLVAAQLLESARDVLAHLSRWRIELQEADDEGPPGLTQCYRRVRRLKDYLQRAASSYSHTVTIDLDEDDENLLAACMVHAIGHIENQLEQQVPPVSPRDASWMREKVKTLMTWGAELGSRPIDRIPAPNEFRLNTEGVREMISTINRKHQAIIAKTTRPALPEVDDPPYDGDALPVQHDSPQFDAMPAISASPDLGPSASPHDQPVADADAGAGSRLAVGAPGVCAEALPQENTDESEESEGNLSVIDPRSLRDPRLRAMLVLDTRAFDRAMAAKDYRLAMVHLSSLLEGAVTDHALTQSEQLGLQGTPDTWKMEELVVQMAGDRIEAIDRAMLYHLVASRNLIRPAVQLQQPIAVTAVSVRQAMAFVRRALAELGMIGSAQPQSQEPPSQAMPESPPITPSGFFQSTSIRRDRPAPAPDPAPPRRRGPGGGAL